MTDKILKTAIDLAEKEIQEKEIQRIKNIIKDYLKELQDKNSKKLVLDKEIALLKKDIDDFKAGRLDKIADRQKIEPLAPKIIVITRIEKEYVPMTPWYSPFYIQYPIVPHYQNTPWVGGSTITTTSGDGGQSMVYCASNNIGGVASGLNSVNNLSALSASMSAPLDPSMKVVGNVFKNFTGGAYDIGGEVINL